MGCFAEATASKYGYGRNDQDAFATESVRRAKQAIESGAFRDEIAPITIRGRSGDEVVDRDETPFTLDVSRIPTLKPAFRKDGTVTAASSSSISDGGAALVLAGAAAAAERGLRPLARILAYASHAQEPEWFTTAPAPAIRKAVDRAGWSLQDVDLFEINEAFACVTMAATQDLAIDAARVNVNGGACALGHPIGATGARLITTLIHALRARGLSRGIASQCIGGGEATAIAIELIR
jgi:acetyl-CoA C-acetyltransferase